MTSLRARCRIPHTNDRMSDKHNEVSFARSMIEQHGKKMRKAFERAEERYDAQDPAHQRRSEMHRNYPHNKR